MKPRHRTHQLTAAVMIAMLLTVVGCISVRRTAEGTEYSTDWLHYTNGVWQLERKP